MPAFLSAILSFPTVVFTVPMALAAVYWLLVIVGAADLDLFDGADGAMDGALDGAADGAAEAVDGALDGAVDGAADAVDGAVDGAADAAGHSAAEALDGADHAAHAAHAAEGGAMGLLHALKLRNAPITVVASLFAAYGWLLTGVGGELLFGQDKVPLLPAIGLLAAVMPLSLLLTSVTVRPLGVIFRNEGGVSRKHLIGGSATVTTGRVDARFGQALCIHTGAELVLQVRCDRPNTLRKGDEVLLVSFDGQREAFVVEPLHAARQQDAAAGAQPNARRSGTWTSTS